MLFWMICGALAVLVTAVLAAAMWRGGKDAPLAAAFDLQVYKDQLAEVDRDLARGVLGTEDAERTKVEISRRILAADKAMQDGVQSGSGGMSKHINRGAVLGLVCLLGIGSLYTYDRLGAPGYGDLPLQMRIEMSKERRANRPSQEAAEASLPAQPTPLDIAPDYVELVERLREAVAQRPDDLQGAQLLARHEMSLGNAQNAYRAQYNVIRLKGDDVVAEDYATYTDMMVIAAGGYVSPEAERAVAVTLRMDPDNGVARYYSGLLALQIGRPDFAFRTWSALLNDSPADAPWVPPVRAQIEEAAYRAGVEYELPAVKEQRGPSRNDVEAASEMSEAERMEMIRGMVSGLSERLGEEGGPVEDWARLISSLVVLGDGDGALLVYADAKRVFAQDPEAMQLLKQTAQRVGMPE